LSIENSLSGGRFLEKKRGGLHLWKRQSCSTHGLPSQRQSAVDERESRASVGAVRPASSPERGAGSSKRSGKAAPTGCPASDSLSSQWVCLDQGVCLKISLGIPLKHTPWLSSQGVCLKVCPLVKLSANRARVSARWAPDQALNGEGGGRCTRKVDIRLPGKGNSNPHGARPVY
jgi:hypothetical protein